MPLRQLWFTKLWLPNARDKPGWIVNAMSELLHMTKCLTVQDKHELDTTEWTRHDKENRQKQGGINLEAEYIVR